MKQALYPVQKEAVSGVLGAVEKPGLRSALRKKSFLAAFSRAFFSKSFLRPRLSVD